MQLIVTANKLNKRSSVPSALSEKNITGVVLKGFRFEGEEVTDVPNPALGKWYKDRDNAYYWGGGLLVGRNITPPPAAHNFNLQGLPVNLPLNCSLGADLSHHNGTPDWKAITDAGISFVYIKISEGVGSPDPKAREYAAFASTNGLQIGYYHFCRPDTRNGGTAMSDATAEASEALNIMAGLSRPDLPLVLDLEDESNWDTPLNRADYFLWIKTFVAKIKDVSGISPVIYSRKEYLDRKLPHDHDLGNLSLWIANYGQRNCNTVACPIGWNDWQIWQFTESAVVGGNAKLDLNIKKS